VLFRSVFHRHAGAEHPPYGGTPRLRNRQPKLPATFAPFRGVAPKASCLEIRFDMIPASAHGDDVVNRWRHRVNLSCLLAKHGFWQALL
jgi:hypothetical protein